MISPAEQNDPALRPGLSEAELAQAAALLQKLPAGYLPLSIFREITRLSVSPIVEFVPLRLSAGKVEVLLIERGTDEPFWPGILHTPGTVVLPSDFHDGLFDKVFDRLLNRELKGAAIKGQPHFVTNISIDHGRGREVSQIFWVEMLEEPKAGAFYPADNLPPKLVDSQRAFIKTAIADFLAHKQAL